MRFAVWLLTDPNQATADLHGSRREPRIRLRDRLCARLHSRKLDARLAAGEPMAGSRALQHRAHLLTRPSSRRALAAGLRRAAAAEARGSGLGNRIRRAGHDSAGASADLEKLAESIDAGVMVDVRSLARVRELLSDGAGPLYRLRSGESLKERVGEVLTTAEAAGR